MTTDVLTQAETEFSTKVIIEVDKTLAGTRVDGRRVSQAWLAKRIGKSPVWLSDRMTGRVRLTVDDLALMARGLGVEVVDLLPRTLRHAVIGAAAHPDHPMVQGSVRLPSHPGLPPRRTAPTGARLSPQPA
jgi:hypothetical protein